MRKKISVTAAKAKAVEALTKAIRAQCPKPGGAVGELLKDPVVPRPPLPNPTEEQAAIAYKIFCNTPHHASPLREVADQVLLRYLRADLNQQPTRYIPYTATATGGTVCTTAAGTWS